MTNWRTHKKLQCSHIVVCAKCKTPSYEAGTVEAHTVMGSGLWQICKDCLTEFILFIANKGGTMYGNDDPDFGVLALLSDDDLDIAEHHATCECQECMIDGDAQRKFLLENDHEYFQQIYKSA